MRADRRGLWQAGAALALLAGSSRLGTVRAGAPDGKTAETGLLAFRIMPLEAAREALRIVPEPRRGR